MKRIKAEATRAKIVPRNLECNQNLKLKVKQKEAIQEVRTKDQEALVFLKKVIIIEETVVKVKEGAGVDEEIVVEGAKGKKDQGPSLGDGREVDQTGLHLADLNPTRTH